MSDPIKVYHYDPETGEFTGASNAKMSPKEKDVPRVPAYATLDEPPESPAGQVARYDNGWSLVEDHRGEVVYSTDDGSKMDIKELGPLPDGYTTEERPADYYDWDGGVWVKNIERYADHVNQKIKAAFRTARDNGALVTINGNQVRIATSHDATVEIDRLVNILTRDGGTLSITTRSGMSFDADLQQAEAMQAAVDNHHKAVWSNETALLAEVDSAASVDDLDLIDPASGWPD